MQEALLSHVHIDVHYIASYYIYKKIFSLQAVKILKFVTEIDFLYRPANYARVILSIIGH